MSWASLANTVSDLQSYMSNTRSMIMSAHSGYGSMGPRAGGSHATNANSPLEAIMWSAMGGIPVTGQYVTIARIIQGKPTNPVFAAGTTVMSGLILRAVAPKTAAHLAEYYAYQALRLVGFRLSPSQMAKPGPVWAVPTWVYIAVAGGVIYTAYDQAFDTASKGEFLPPTDMN